MSQIAGLSENEVRLRRSQGLGNNTRSVTSRSYIDILRQNVFTFINNVLFGIGLALIILERPGDAFVSVAVVLLNVVVGVIQETRSKQKLDQINLLTRPTVTVMRDRDQVKLDPGELVLGDLIQADPGDQIIVDGIIVDEGRIQVDESLLTGESDLILKQNGDRVYSGSIVISGSAWYEAEKVGAESFASKLTATAKAYRKVMTPVQQEINLVLRLLLMLVSYLWTLLALSSVMQDISMVESVQMAAIIGGLIPNGLLLMLTTTYALGAVRIAQTGALVQQMNAIESLSNVDVLCLDKTGTLTANCLVLNQVDPIGISEAELQQKLGIYTASTKAGNRTNEAIANACPGTAYPVTQEIPFSSDRKWSALAFDLPEFQGIYVLGAPEMMEVYVNLDPDWQIRISDLTKCGLRVLLFAYYDQVQPLYNDDGKPQLPAKLIPLGLVSISDELRPQAAETLHGFRQLGIDIKIISGDHPETVAALAKQAGFDPDLTVISGPELAIMAPEELAIAADQTTIFGRITPEQKEQLVGAFRSRGHYVAMIGDGVNDVMSLKKANLGIAMQSGSAATRNVADMVLLNDSFAALLPAIQEGQRIVNGIQDILKLFLTRILYVTMLINSTAFVGVGFPFAVKQNSLLVMLTVGIPPLAMAAWAKPGKSPRGLIRSVLHFVLPAAFTLLIVTMIVYVGYLVKSGEQDVAQTAVTTTAILCGLLLICFVEPPTKAWVGGDSLSGDWRPSLVAFMMLVVYVIIVVNPSLRSFFELVLLDQKDYLLIAAIAALWGFMLRFIWRQRLLDRFLDVDLSVHY